MSFATEGSPIDYMMRNLLDQNGMTMDDMDVQRLTSADALVGLQNRAVDVATAAEPFPTQVEQMGAAVKWLTDGDVVPGYQISTIMFSEKFVTQPWWCGRSWSRTCARSASTWPPTAAVPTRACGPPSASGPPCRPGDDCPVWRAPT